MIFLKIKIIKRSCVFKIAICSIAPPNSFSFRMLAATEVAELSPVKPIVTQTEDFGRKFGQIGQFLAKGGYGWILEQDEMPKSDVPLMTELDIEPNEIWYKIRCVLLPLPQVIITRVFSLDG